MAYILRRRSKLPAVAYFGASQVFTIGFNLYSFEQPPPVREEVFAVANHPLSKFSNLSRNRLVSPNPKEHSQMPCPICQLPVPLETAKTDEKGRAIHEQCYVLKLVIAEQQRRVDELCRMIADEQNPAKVTELARELNQLLEAKSP
jgi:hypothetical protein